MLSGSTMARFECMPSCHWSRSRARARTTSERALQATHARARRVLERAWSARRAADGVGAGEMARAASAAAETPFDALNQGFFIHIKHYDLWFHFNFYNYIIPII
jgi:hypothetical protein